MTFSVLLATQAKTSVLNVLVIGYAYLAYMTCIEQMYVL